jgi:hypothetical protein
MDPLPGDVIEIRPGGPLPADKAPGDQLRADPGPEPCGIPEEATDDFRGFGESEFLQVAGVLRDAGCSS